MGLFFRCLTLLCASLGGLAVASAAADTADTSEARADLQPSDDAEGAQAHLRNQTYDLISSQLGPDRYAWTNLLVHRQQDLVTNLQIDGFLKKELTVDVFRVDGLKKTKLFQIKENASDSSIHQDLGILVASSYGCCDATDAHAVYSLKNGKRLFFAGGDRSPYIFHVTWPNTDRGWLVGVHVSGSERDGEIYRGFGKGQRHRRMLVSLATKAKLVDQIVVLFDDGDVSPPVDTVGWVPSEEMKVHDRELEVWPPKGDNPAAVPLLQIILAGSEKILIPVDADRFGKVSAPNGVTVSRVSAVK